jgi:isomerase DpgB
VVSPDGDPLTISIDGARPLSSSSVRALAALCDRAESADGSDPVIVHVGGAPGAGWAESLTIALVTQWERVVRRLEQLPTGTVAVGAAGDCGGPALDVLLATDLRLATPTTRLVTTGPGAAGWPGMSAYRLVQQAGAARIRRALLFGVPIEAGEALELGLLHEVSPAPVVAAGLMAGRAGRELAIRRRLLLDATTTSFDEALGMHLAACDRTLRQVSELATT